MLIQDGRMKPDGYIQIVGDGPTVEADTKQCGHCGGHFVIVRGSGTRRGWCNYCSAVLCGREACFMCRPYAKLVAEGTR